MFLVTGNEGQLPLHRTAATRALEVRTAKGLPAHALMARAATSTAILAQSIAPFAKTVWVPCGPGNNGGDGLLTAALLTPWVSRNGGKLSVTWYGDEARMPDDARWALSLAREAGVQFAPPPTSRCDLVIDAILGIGATKRFYPPQRPTGGIDGALHSFRTLGETLLCIDTPSDLDSDTGELLIASSSFYKSNERVYTITFLTLKPGLFTGHGRDAAGDVWFDDLGCPALQDAPSAQNTTDALEATARLNNCASTFVAQSPFPASTARLRCAGNHHERHSTHKGDFGDAWIVGGQGISQSGHAMTGAVLLAARAALYSGAGRVFVVPLDTTQPISNDPSTPELMFRHVDMLTSSSPLPSGVWVCGCGGGTAVQEVLPTLLKQAQVLVLDADALNAIANDHDLRQLLLNRQVAQQHTVLTPHPLEAARLLGVSTSAVQCNRLHAAQSIADQLQAICVLKGSGTVVAAPHTLPAINTSGNSKLSTAGTGDVLAGLIGATLARQVTGCANNSTKVQSLQGPHTTILDALFEGVCQAVWLHGHQADVWPQNQQLTAHQLASSLIRT